LFLLSILKLSSKRSLFSSKSIIKSFKFEHSGHMSLLHIHESGVDSSRNTNNELTKKIREKLIRNRFSAILNEMTEYLISKFSRITRNIQ